MSIYTLSQEDKEVFESLKNIKLDKATLEDITFSCSGIYNPMFGVKQSDYQKQKQSKMMKGKTIAKTPTGEILLVSVEDPRFKTGDLVGNAKNKVAVKDQSGNFYLVDKKDPRYISGDLVGVNKGRKYKQKVPSPHKGTFLVKNREGNMVRLRKDDPRYLSGEFIHFRKKF